VGKPGKEGGGAKVAMTKEKVVFSVNDRHNHKIIRERKESKCHHQKFGYFSL
jgi:hypothetical protein